MFSGYGRNAAIGFGIAALRACFVNRHILSFFLLDHFNPRGLRMLNMSNLDCLIMSPIPTFGTREPAGYLLHV